jgi:hypothetical protein
LGGSFLHARIGLEGESNDEGVVNFVIAKGVQEGEMAWIEFIPHFFQGMRAIEVCL